MRDEFYEFWQTYFPDCPPVAYLLKKRFSEIWFRTHSLPESKRYAENDLEMSEILRRQKILIEDIIGTKDECFVVCGCYNETPQVSYLESFPCLVDFLQFNLTPVPIKSFESDWEIGELFQIAYGKREIVFDDFREIFIGIADWKIAHFFIVNPISKRIFAPYDGGVDLILENEEKRNEFKEKYKDWLSNHPDGY